MSEFLREHVSCQRGFARFAFVVVVKRSLSEYDDDNNQLELCAEFPHSQRPYAL